MTVLFFIKFCFEFLIFSRNSYFKQFYNPPTKYSIKTSHPKKPKSLRIYEAHVGISGNEGKINSYRDFSENILPRIAKQGYFLF